jgi:Co/Zn/Cd efflux system component/copper chaperone CopZ
MTAAELAFPMRYRVTGMDCSACATKIEGAARKVAGIDQVRVSIASQEMTLHLTGNATPLSELERAVTELGYQLTRLDQQGTNGDIPDMTHVTPAYKRALWIVVLLNAGYGLVEIVGGFFASSQSVKADALDFIGDGLISFLGLIAIGWGLAARAKTALLQGIFLGTLGVCVLGITAYRFFYLQQPEAELMGIFGAIGLAVNIAAAAVLLPHRHGDANVRAIWLFSRNDAIANVAVVIAAALVSWTQTSWPDLVVALVIAGLFLHSAYSIIKDAQEDLRTANRSARRTANSR